MKLNAKDMTPAIMCCNEDFWIYYVLKDIYKIFENIIVLDTGSDDNTLNIIKTEYPKVQLIEESYGHDANLIGNGRNVLRSLCKTHWMYLIDGDEIYRTDNILKIFEREVPDDTGVVMLGLANVEDVDGQLKLRTHDYVNRDALFTSEIKWTATSYPFEGYGLSDTFPMERVHYIDAREVYGYHMRHTIRSSKNSNAYFRDKKYGYYPYNGEYSELTEDWLGEINCEHFNSYLC